MALAGWSCLFLLVASAWAADLSYRLPGDLIPQLYDLRILTNIADFNENYTFSGDVAIAVKVQTNTNKIVLHSRELAIEESGVRVVSGVGNATDLCRSKTPLAQGTDLRVTQHSYDRDLDYYIIHTDSDLEVGQEYVLCVPFQGQLTPGLAGYYRSSYKDLASGETRWLAVTQFESTDARRAFPCFDEPGMKARFLVTLGHVMAKSAISNMPLSSSEPIQGMDGWVWDRFQVTVPMSTYLLAFMVSDLEYEPSPRVASNNVAFRVWARKDAVGQVKFAAEIGPKILEDYEKYFDIKYPLPKQDMVAVPDFSAGAMENWGLITYRETALLFDPKFTSASQQPYVVSVIAHEIAHQWFGNLVTMRWWTDLWLNEGFATYMASQETHKLYPEWEYLDESVVSNLFSVMGLDSLKSSHPISLPIGHPREIAQIFDTISYKKGSYMLRMMNRFLGEDTFRTGVSNYLKKHAFKNAEQDDLWTSLTQEAHRTGALPTNMTVKAIMDTWTLQTGYPLLTVTRDYSKGEAVVRQDRYLADRAANDVADNTTWWVPLTFTTASERNFNDTKPKLWLPAGRRETTVAGLPEADWVVFNVQLAGLYRINYDAENWRMLTSTLNSDHFKDIGLLNRVQLIDDSLDLARTGDVDYNVPLHILQYMKRETEYLPWRAALAGLNELDRLLKGSALYGPFKSYVKGVLMPIYNQTSGRELDETPKNLHNIKLQNLVSSWACKLGLGDCRARAVHLFRQWMASTNPDEINPVPKNSRDHVYCNAIREGGEDEWNFAWKRFLNSNVGAHKTEILRALACTREAWLLNRYLRWAIDESSGIKRQDSRTVFSGVSRNDLGYFLAKVFFKQHIADIYRHHGSKTARLSSYISALTSHVTTQAELDEYVAFTESNACYLKGATQSVNQALESAKINVLWQQKFYKGMSKFLADPSENTIGTT